MTRATRLSSPLPTARHEMRSSPTLSRRQGARPFSARSFAFGRQRLVGEYIGHRAQGCAVIVRMELA
jgi:hypothetical protein